MKSTFPATLRKGVICPLPDVAGRVAVEFARFAPDAVLDVTVEPHQKTRSTRQNARMWAILKVFESLGYRKHEAHEYCARRFLPPRVVTWPNGRQEVLPAYTHTLSTAEMSEYMDAIEQHLNEEGVWFPTFV